MPSMISSPLLAIQPLAAPRHAGGPGPGRDPPSRPASPYSASPYSASPVHSLLSAQLKLAGRTPRPASVAPAATSAPASPVAPPAASAATALAPLRIPSPPLIRSTSAAGTSTPTRLTLAKLSPSPATAPASPASAAGSVAAAAFAGRAHAALYTSTAAADLADLLDRLRASARLATVWLANTGANPHTRRLYHEYRPMAAGGHPGRVLKRDAASELLTVAHLLHALPHLPTQDPTTARSLTLTIRAVLGHYTSLLIPLPTPQRSNSASVALTLDARGLGEPVSVAALAALLDALLAIRTRPVTSPTGVAAVGSLIDDPVWVADACAGLARGIAAHISTINGTMRVYLDFPTAVGMLAEQHPADVVAVLDALAALASFSVSTYGEAIRTVARTHLAAWARQADREAVRAAARVRVDGGDWDPASLHYLEEDSEDEVAANSATTAADWVDAQIAVAARSARLAHIIPALVGDLAIGLWDRLVDGRALANPESLTTTALTSIVHAVPLLTLDPARAAVLEPILAGSVRALARRQVVRAHGDRMAVGGFPRGASPVAVSWTASDMHVQEVVGVAEAVRAIVVAARVLERGGSEAAEWSASAMSPSLLPMQPKMAKVDSGVWNDPIALV